MRWVFRLLILAFAVLANPALAGDPVLTVSGQGANGPVKITFDQAALDALPQQTITTGTPWYEGKRSFSGPLLQALVEKAGVKGQTLRVVALNDYAATLPYADLGQFGVVLASRIDGKLLSVRDKGPLFVMYPFDSSEALRQETYYARAVWQVDRIIVE